MHISASSTIIVHVLFFGSVADAAGVRETEIELAPPSTVGDAHAGLLRLFPELEGISVKYAVEQEFCSGFHLLADREELALFTAVSGG